MSSNKGFPTARGCMALHGAVQMLCHLAGAGRGALLPRTSIIQPLPLQPLCCAVLCCAAQVKAERFILDGELLVYNKAK